MNRFIKRSVLGLIGGALLAGSLVGCAANRFGSGDSADMRTKMVERVASKLDLDPTQQQKLGTLADKLNAQRTAMRGQSDPREQFKSLIAGNKFDQSGAAKLINEKTDAVRSGSPEVIAAAADFFDSLNPAQQQKVREFMDRGRRWGHRG